MAFTEYFYTPRGIKLPIKYCIICKEKIQWKSKSKQQRVDVKQYLKTKFCSLECKGIWQKDNLNGESNPNWKGGISTEYELLHGSKKYTKWREEIYTRDKYKCQKCYIKGGQLNAHHITSFTYNKDDRFDTNNGITLCKDCHDEFHNLYGKSINDPSLTYNFIEGD